MWATAPDIVFLKRKTEEFVFSAQFDENYGKNALFVMSQLPL